MGRHIGTQDNLRINSGTAYSLFSTPPVTKTASFTLGAAENYVICNGAGSIAITFPDATKNAGRVVRVKTIAAQTVTAVGSVVVPRAGGAAGTAILAGVAGNWAELVSDGTNWVVMSGT